MKLSDLSDLSKDDILSALGLSTKPSTTERLLGTAGVFGLGLLFGAGAALLLAPKSGQGLREELGERLRRVRNGETAPAGASGAPSSPTEART
jgi:gas vesicle protein